jgi:uncharacterized protein YdeI (YjbR/CyaY-like superfamily)
MAPKDSVKIFRAKTRKAWRKWLEKNHAKEKSVWLIMYRKATNIPSVNYAEAVEEALCFGWIDSIKKKRDTESSIQFFSQRKPKSSWSKLNRDRADKLTKQGLMTPQGQAMIDLAKRTGTWSAMKEVENTVIPSDLKELFNKNVIAFNNFQSFPVSSKKIILTWILSAKTPETRRKRIKETVALARKNIRANHYSNR